MDDDGFEVLKNEQGRTMLYYRDKTFDITNYLDENGCGKVRFKESNQPFAKTVYVTIDSDNSSGLESYSYGMGYRPDGSRTDYIWLDK